METFEAIEKRRSIRRFKDRPVQRELLLKLLEAARLAPSSSNTQSWSFKIVTDPEEKRKLRKACYGQAFIEACSAVIVCCVDFSQFEFKGKRTLELVRTGAVRPSLEMILRSVRGGKDREYEDERKIINGVINVSIAAEHIVLAAADLGLGTCWVRAFDHERVTDTVKPPENNVVLCLLAIGYPDQEPDMRPRRKLDEMIFE